MIPLMERCQGAVARRPSATRLFFAVAFVLIAGAARADGPGVWTPTARWAQASPGGR